MKTPPSTAQLKAVIQGLLPDAAAAWLFGSAVRNEMRSDSDVDVALWMPAAWSPAEKMKAHDLLSNALGTPVDILDFSRLPTVMQVQILETGELLFADDPVAVEMYCATVKTEYLHIQRWRQPMIRTLTDELNAPNETILA
jgi:uncharacterized protein